MQRLILVFVLIALLGVAAGSSAAVEAAPGYVMRYADVGGGQVVFTYEDDLWLVPVAGGEAHRITAHPGVEQYAKFSPDGKRLAFTAGYDGGADVYVMDTDGGVPVRLTFHPGYDQVLDWCPDGQGILFRANRKAPMGSPEVYRIAVGGGMPVELPLDQAARWPGPRRQRPRLQPHRAARPAPGSATRAAWPRTSGWPPSPTARSPRSPTGRAPTSSPCGMGSTIYFNSDREDGTLNIYGYDTATKRTAAPDHVPGLRREVPLRAATGWIVFQYGAGLSVLDTASGQVAARAHRDPLGPAPRAQRTGDARAQGRRLRSVARRRAGPDRGPRRDPQPAGRRGRRPEPDPHPRLPREERRLEPATATQVVVLSPTAPARSSSTWWTSAAAAPGSS